MGKETKHQIRVNERAQALLLRHREHNRPYNQQFRGWTFEILPGVFNPAYGEGAGLLVDNLDVLNGEYALELGTGSGAVAIAAASKGARIVATDLSPAAVECARRNVERLSFQDRVDVRQGDLFGAVGADEKFSLILFNPPFMRGTPHDWLEAAMYDEDYSILTRFLAELRQWMTLDGRALVVFSTAGDILYFGQQVAKNGLRSEPLADEVENDIAFVLYEIQACTQTLGDGQDEGA